MLLYSFNFLENFFYNVFLIGISVLGCFFYWAGLPVIYLGSCEMSLEVGTCIFSREFLSHFPTDSANINAVVIIILPMLILCSFVSVVPCASTIVV